MSGWQPIETAPKYGWACLAVPHGNRWSFHHGWFNPETEEWEDDFGDFTLIQATHWMPLPEPSK